MTKEELENKLKKPYYGCDSNLTLEWIMEDENGFSRHLKVVTEAGYSFIILWYKNLLTIELPNGISSWAHDIYTCSTMPHNSMLDIRTSYNNIDSGFCIRIREYKASE